MGHEGHDHDDHHHGHHAHGHGPRPSHHLPHVPAGTAAGHRAHAPAQVSTFVVTCSDSRNASSDESGEAIRALLEGEGHPIAGSRVVKDDAAEIRAALDAALEAGARAIILTGGTGIAPRDVTVETVEALFDKRLPGFGELFRALSFQEIGAAAWLSRATAGVCRGAVVFALPGSPQAVRLALTRLVLPELGHAVRELSR